MFPACRVEVADEVSVRIDAADGIGVGVTCGNVVVEHGGGGRFSESCPAARAVLVVDAVSFRAADSIPADFYTVGGAFELGNYGCGYFFGQLEVEDAVAC